MNGKWAPCRLCHKEDQLSFSHILPEFLYEHLYDDKHRLIGLRPQSGADEDILQKGIREYLLCSACESLLSKWESYASVILRGLPNTAKERAGSIVFVEQVEYFRFKLFQLSLLWRASVSHHRSFNEVQLGPHEEKLRKMIHDGDPGEPWEFGCVLIRTSGPETLDQLIKLPSSLRVGGHNGYQFLLAGMFWNYVASKHSRQLSERKLFLTRDHLLPIHISGMTAEGYITKLGRALREDGIIS